MIRRSLRGKYQLLLVTMESTIRGAGGDGGAFPTPGTSRRARRN
jgi:hypothetical protein